MSSSWKGIALDGLGQILTGWIAEDGKVAIGIDVVPPHREESANSGFLWPRFEGWGTNGTSLNQDYKKTAALYYEDDLAVAVGGRAGSASPGAATAGGIHVRTSFGAGSKWDIVSTRFARSCREIASTKPRQGGRCIAVAKSASPKVVWVSCQDSASSPVADQYGIVRSTDGGATFSAWHVPDRNYTGLFWLADDPTTLYATANDYGSAAGGVFKFANATTAAAAPTQLDGAATNNGTDWNDLFVCKVGAVIHLFAARGNQSQVGANQAAGVWHWRSDTGAWRNITPTNLMTVTTAAGQQSSTNYTNWKSITGQVVAGKVNLMVQCWRTAYSEAGFGTYTLSDGTNSSYVATHVRLLDATVNGTSAWECVSQAANVGSGSSPATIWGTGSFGSPAGEAWVQDRIGESFGERSRLGGNNYRGAQLMMSPVGGFLMSFDKAGSYRCDNPWAASASAVKWQPFVAGLSAIDSLGVICDPSQPKRWALCDIDRSYACWDDAGDGQPNTLGPDPMPSSPQCISLSRTTVDNYAIITAGNGKGYELNNWWLANCATVFTWAPGFDENCMGGCKFTNAGGQTVRLAVGNIGTGRAAVGTLKRAVGDSGLTTAANWSAPTGVGTLTLDANEPCYFAWKDGTDYVVMLVPSSGVYRSTNSGQAWTQVLAFDTSTNWFGHLSQSSDRNTIYYTLGDGPWLFRWVNWQTTTIPGSGSGNAWKSFTGGGFAGPVCALSNGDIAVIRQYKDGTLADIHYYTAATTTWAGIEDQHFQGGVILPHGIAGGVDASGTYLYVVGDAAAGFRYTPNPVTGTNYTGAGSFSGAASFAGTAKMGYRSGGVMVFASGAFTSTAKVGFRASASTTVRGTFTAAGEIGATSFSGEGAFAGRGVFIASAYIPSSAYVDPQPPPPRVDGFGFDPSVWPPRPITPGGRRHRRF